MKVIYGSWSLCLRSIQRKVMREPKEEQRPNAIDAPSSVNAPSESSHHVLCRQRPRQHTHNSTWEREGKDPEPFSYDGRYTVILRRLRLTVSIIAMTRLTLVSGPFSGREGGGGEGGGLQQLLSYSSKFPSPPPSP